MGTRPKLIAWHLTCSLAAVAAWGWIPALETGRLTEQLRERGEHFEVNGCSTFRALPV